MKDQPKQGDSNSIDSLDKILNWLEMLINGSNPTNYIMGDEPKIKQRLDGFKTTKLALQQWNNRNLIEELKRIYKYKDFDYWLPKSCPGVDEYLKDRLEVLRFRRQEKGMNTSQEGVRWLRK